MKKCALIRKVRLTTRVYGSLRGRCINSYTPLQKVYMRFIHLILQPDWPEFTTMVQALFAHFNTIFIFMISRLDNGGHHPLSRVLYMQKIGFMLYLLD